MIVVVCVALGFALGIVFGSPGSVAFQVTACAGFCGRLGLICGAGVCWCDL